MEGNIGSIVVNGPARQFRVPALHLSKRDDLGESPGKRYTLLDVGLGYITLGQSATTLSGGEAQRIKLASFLARETSEKTLFIFDEPTTGLHFDDINKLLIAFRRLIETGGSVLIIEHNLDVIRNADWIIDLGPEGGEEGGRIVAQGTPEQVARVKKSYTGQALAGYFENGKKAMVSRV